MGYFVHLPLKKQQTYHKNKVSQNFYFYLFMVSSIKPIVFKVFFRSPKISQKLCNISFFPTQVYLWDILFTWHQNNNNKNDKNKVLQNFYFYLIFLLSIGSSNKAINMGSLLLRHSKNMPVVNCFNRYRMQMTIHMVSFFNLAYHVW